MDYRRLGMIIAMCLAIFSPLQSLGAAREPSAIFNSDGVDIYFSDYGPEYAPAVLLLHGFMVDSELNWKATIPFLERHFRVITMDARGHGKSGKPHDPQSYGKEMALDAIRLLDHLGIEKAHIGGFSMGGLISLYLAATHPERLFSAIIGGYGLVGKDHHEAGTSHLDATLTKSIETKEPVPSVLKSQLKGLDPAQFKHEPLMQFYSDLESVSIDPVALRYAHRTLASMVVSREQVQTITIPLLAISGDRDPAYDMAVALRAENPGLTSVAIIPDYGHSNGFLSPLFNMSIEYFLLENSRITTF